MARTPARTLPMLTQARAQAFIAVLQNTLSKLVSRADYVVLITNEFEDGVSADDESHVLITAKRESQIEAEAWERARPAQPAHPPASGPGGGGLVPASGGPVPAPSAFYSDVPGALKRLAPPPLSHPHQRSQRRPRQARPAAGPRAGARRLKSRPLGYRVG